MQIAPTLSTETLRVLRGHARPCDRLDCHHSYLHTAAAVAAVFVHNGSSLCTATRALLLSVDAVRCLVRASGRDRHVLCLSGGGNALMSRAAGFVLGVWTVM